MFIFDLLLSSINILADVTANLVSDNDPSTVLSFLQFHLIIFKFLVKKWKIKVIENKSV